MRKLFFITAALVLTIALVSCEKDIITYQGKSNIYFNDAGKIPTTTSTNTDSTVLSFSLVSNTDSVQKLIVATNGAPADIDRPYKIQIDEAASTAIPGVHYEILDEVFAIGKGNVRDTVNIRFIRTKDMQSTSFKLFFDLVANENFSTEMKEKVINATTGKTMSFLKYRFFVNDIVKKPARWLDTYFGTFTRKKLFLICEVFEISPSYLDTSISVSELVAYSKVMQRYLNQQKLQGKTVYEEDGTEMTMGTSAQ
jgi:hypothetical protein